MSDSEDAESPHVPSQSALAAGTGTSDDGRPLPFVLRRCIVWNPEDDDPSERSSFLKFWMRAGLTGAAATSDRRDLSFTDVDVS